MIYYNLVKEALAEIWHDWKYERLSLWNFFKNTLFSILIIIFFMFFIPIDIVLFPLEIGAVIYYFFKIDK